MKIIKLFTLVGLMLIAYSLPLFGQFTTGNDTLLIASGDSCTYYYEAGDTTAGYDLNGKILVGIDFDSTSAWTAATFSIQTSATYNAAADTTGGSPYVWKTINYEGDVYTFTPETRAINILKPQVIYALKRYVRFIGASAEAAPRKLVPLIRSGF